MKTKAEKYLPNLGEWKPGVLRDARLSVKMSQAEVAGRLGVVPDIIRRWEKGESQPRADHAMRLLLMYRLRPWDVMGIAAPTALRDDRTWIAEDALQGLSYRTLGVLVRAGINTLSELQSMPDSGIIALRGIGAVGLEEIESLLNRKLRREPRPRPQPNLIRETRTCVVCGSSTTKPPSQFRVPPERTTCSKQCSGTFRKGKSK